MRTTEKGRKKGESPERLEEISFYVFFVILRYSPDFPPRPPWKDWLFELRFLE